MAVLILRWLWFGSDNRATQAIGLSITTPSPDFMHYCGILKDIGRVKTIYAPKI
jgi:hypothetical protein